VVPQPRMGSMGGRPTLSRYWKYAASLRSSRWITAPNLSGGIGEGEPSAYGLW
jgi:hypothetical protein